jgi:hypothetical protein
LFIGLNGSLKILIIFNVFFALSRLYGGGEALPATAPGQEKKKKVTLCVKFVANGTCPYGPHCSFAHSVKEVRAALEAYKTESESATGIVFG